MKLKVKDVDIATGGVQIVLLNEEDAHKLDLHHGDRVSVKKGKKITTATLNIAESRKAVPPGKIGLYEEVLDSLNAKHNDLVDIDIEEKPIGVSYIQKKLQGMKLNKQEINELVKEIVSNKLTGIELTYFIAACFTNGMTLQETIALTKAIVKYGSRLDIKKYPIIDKHSSGGVPGNRTTMTIVPIIAAAGLTMPKTSSRSITSPAGTADTMEVLAPVSLSLEKMKKVVMKTNACIVWGGAIDLAAADDKLIKLRHPLALDPEGMLLASILAKKAAVNSTHVLIDIPLGRDTKIKTRKHARHLKRLFIKIGRKLGIHIHVILTNGEEPIGNGIGPALEARDVLWLLKRDTRRPLDLEKKSIMMATKILQMANIKDAKKKVIEILDSGLAYKKMQEIIKAQGGDPNIDPDKIKIGKYSYTFKAPASGRITDIQNFTINKIARIAGAPVDKGAGVYFYHKHEGMKIKRGEKLMTIYAENPIRLKYALHILRKIGGIVVDGRTLKK
ncbi:AMP phosphorylase [Candidatus Woesearchaeota archaeon]|nr:AMP phosphorylase [Candidatus Woesearchaeota archaeon]